MHGSNQPFYLMFIGCKGPEKNTKPRIERVERAVRIVVYAYGQKRTQNAHDFTNDLPTL